MVKSFNVNNDVIYLEWGGFEPYPILNKHPYVLEGVSKEELEVNYTDERFYIHEIQEWGRLSTKEKIVNDFLIENIYYDVNKDASPYQVSIPSDLFTEAEYGTIFRNILPKIRKYKLCNHSALTTDRETILVKNKYSVANDLHNHPKFYYMFTDTTGEFLTLYSLLFIYNFADDFVRIKKKCAKHFAYLELYKGLETIKETNDRPELIFRDKLYDVIKPLGITMEWQFNVVVDDNTFKLDFYLPDYNLVIEYDEKAHKYRKSEDARRQKMIEDKFGYEFLRVSEENSDEFNIGLVMQHIIAKNVKKKELNHIDTIKNICDTIVNNQNEIKDTCINMVDMQSEIRNRLEKNNKKLIQHIIDIKPTKESLIKRVQKYIKGSYTIN